MGKTTAKNNKLNRAIVVSAVLHILLIVILIWGSLHKSAEVRVGGDGAVVDAIMVDPRAIMEQYNRQQQQINDKQRAEKQRQKKAAQQAEELLRKQAEEQQRLKELKQASLAAQDKAAQDAMALSKKQKAAEQAIAKARDEQKAAEQAAAKAKIEADKIAKSQAEAQKRAEAEAQKEAARKQLEEAKKVAAAQAEKKAAEEAQRKADAESAKQSADVGNLFDDLANDKNAPSRNDTKAKDIGQGNVTSGASGAALSDYMGKMQSAIQSKFYDPNSFIGKTCKLHIELTPDGALKDVTAVGGDPALCQAAVSAAKLANMPKPPNHAVYEYVKDAILEFKPQ